MTEQKKLWRIFNLIRHLNTPPGKTVKQLERIFDVSNSTIHRDLILIEELGYPVEVNDKNQYFLQLQFEKGAKGTFEPEELFFLQEHLQQISANSPHAQNILHKLDLNLSLIPLADALPQLHLSRMLQLIRYGISAQKCLLLKRYRSLTSNNVTDRRIEPLEITQDFRYLIAWDLDKDGQRQFKIERIEDIDILEIAVSPRRIPSPMDIFGLTGEAWLPVKMRLSPTAYHLLVEEFPLSRQFIRKVRDVVIFDGMVRNWKGIGRFVLGLPGEIEVLDPLEFLDYLKKRLEDFGVSQ